MRLPLELHPQSPARKVLAAILIAVAAAGIAIALRATPGISVPLAKLDNVLYDSLYRLPPIQDQQDGEVVIVAVDEKSLKDLSSGMVGKTRYGWPWPRSFWGYMVDYFSKSGAKVVAFDIIFSEPSVFHDLSGDDKEFGAKVERSKVPVVFAAVIGPDGKPGEFGPTVQAPIFGAVNVGNDRIYRTFQPMVYGYPSLASKAVMEAGGTPIDQPFLLHYYGPYRSDSGRTTFRYVSASHVLAAGINKKNTGVEPGMFKDKIVLVGAITAGTYDLKSSPLSAEYPGVEVQATAIANMLGGQRVLVVPPIWLGLAIFLASLLTAIGVAMPRSVSIKLAFAAMMLAALLALAVSLFLHNPIHWLPLASPLLALLLATVGAFAWSYLAEGRQRQLVLKALSQYLSPEVAAQIDRDHRVLKLGGEKREMTVMFTDIQGFTDLSEKLDEHTLTHLLNYYLDEMSSLVFANNGTLDKYIGDAIMSFWNAPLNQPDHAILACRAALAMARREEEIQPRLTELGATGLLTRIGINTGPMVCGNMGSNQKFNYSVLGDAVNLASRCESANKFYGSRILLAQQTADEVKELFLVRQLDLLRVKGKQKPMGVFELLAEGSGSPGLQQRKADYETSFVLYQQQRWEEAERILLKMLVKFSEDLPVAALLKRIRDLRDDPPGADWDGVYVAKHK